MTTKLYRLDTGQTGWKWCILYIFISWSIEKLENWRVILDLWYVDLYLYYLYCTFLVYWLLNSQTHWWKSHREQFGVQCQGPRRAAETGDRTADLIGGRPAHPHSHRQTKYNLPKTSPLYLVPCPDSLSLQISLTSPSSLWRQFIRSDDCTWVIIYGKFTESFDLFSFLFFLSVSVKTADMQIKKPIEGKQTHPGVLYTRENSPNCVYCTLNEDQAFLHPFCVLKVKVTTVNKMPRATTAVQQTVTKIGFLQAAKVVCLKLL